MTKLTTFAQRLNASAQSGGPPALYFLTDRSRVRDPLAVISRMPPNCGVVLRDYDASNRQAIAGAIAAVARQRNLRLLVGGDGDLARTVSAAGIHLPEARISETARWRYRFPRWLITVSAHSGRSLRAAARGGADAAFLGPAFTTESHPGGSVLGVHRLRVLAQTSPIPVIAIGGLNADNVEHLRGISITGIAAISGLANELAPSVH